MGDAIQWLLSPVVDAGYGWVLILVFSIILLPIGWALAVAFRDRRDR